MKKFVFFLAPLMAISFLTNCGGQSGPKQYTVTWKNDDGNVLSTTKVKESEMPVYDKGTPTKTGTDVIKYTFDDWNPKLVPATCDTTYTAKYFTSYKITFDPNGGTWYDGEKTPKSYWVNENEMPTVPESPYKEDTDKKYYFFSSWDKEIEPATKAVTYKAVYGAISTACLITVICNNCYAVITNGSDKAQTYSRLAALGSKVNIPFVLPDSMDHGVKLNSFLIDGTPSTDYSFDCAKDKISFNAKGDTVIRVSAIERTNLFMRMRYHYHPNYTGKEKHVAYAHQSGPLMTTDWGDGAVTEDQFTQSDHTYNYHEEIDFTIYVSGSTSFVSFGDDSHRLGEGNGHITSIVIYGPMSYFYDRSLAHLNSLIHFEFPNNVDQLQMFLFTEDSSIKSIVFPKSTRVVDNYIISMSMNSFRVAYCEKGINRTYWNGKWFEHESAKIDWDYEPSRVSVTFDPNGGTWSDGTSLTRTSSTYNKLYIDNFAAQVYYNKPIKNTSKLIGWNTRKDGKGIDYTDQIIDISNPLTLYAIYA